MLFKEKLTYAKDVYNDMHNLLVFAEDGDSYHILWDTFWEIDKTFPFEVDWCDPNGSYEDDMRARLKALQEFLQL